MFLQNVEQLVRLLALGFHDLRRPKVWLMLFLLWAGHLFALMVAADPTNSLWAGAIAPLVRWRFGDLYLHYPDSWIGLPMTGSALRLAVDLFLLPFVLLWIARVVLALSQRRAPASAAATRPESDSGTGEPRASSFRAGPAPARGQARDGTHARARRLPGPPRLPRPKAQRPDGPQSPEADHQTGHRPPLTPGGAGPPRGPSGSTRRGRPPGPARGPLLWLCPRAAHPRGRPPEAHRGPCAAAQCGNGAPAPLEP